MVKRKICLFFKIQHLGRKSINKFVQRLDLRKYGYHRVLKATMVPKHQHQILLFTRQSAEANMPGGSRSGRPWHNLQLRKSLHLDDPKLLEEIVDKSPNVFPEQYQDDALHNKCGYSCEGWYPVATLRTCNKNCYKNNA